MTPRQPKDAILEASESLASEIMTESHCLEAYQSGVTAIDRAIREQVERATKARDHEWWEALALVDSVEPTPEAVKRWVLQTAELRADEKVQASRKQLITDWMDDMPCSPKCDSYAHEDDCPHAYPEAAFRQLRVRLQAERDLCDKLAEMVKRFRSYYVGDHRLGGKEDTNAEIVRADALLADHARGRAK